MNNSKLTILFLLYLNLLSRLHLIEKKRHTHTHTCLFVNGCICLSLNLCSSAACLKLPSSVETLCKDIHNFINHSPKRLLKFKEFPQFARVDVHRLLNTIVKQDGLP